MIRHPRRSIPATIVALVLLALCVLTVTSVVQGLLGQTPLIDLDQLLKVSSRQHWNSVATITAAIAAATLGLILLLVAIRPGQPTVMPLGRLINPDGAPGADAGVHRLSLTKDLTGTAEAIPGVTKATITATRARVTAEITVTAADPVQVPGQVKERLEARLVDVGPAPRPRVRIRARRGDTG